MIQYKYIPLLFLSFYTLSNCFKINLFDNAIGKWKLLYSSNKFITNNKKFNICINPCKENIDEVCVKIKRYESNNFITYSKIINCALSNDMNNNQVCSLLVLKTEKYIKSIGIFEFPYFAVEYISGMRPKYFLNWRVDNSRLYIVLDNNTYIFEKMVYDESSDETKITTNAFIITNLLSFLFGKFLEKTFHLCQ
jgi:hypothetical protein